VLEIAARMTVKTHAVGLYPARVATSHHAEAAEAVRGTVRTSEIAGYGRMKSAVSPSALTPTAKIGASYQSVPARRWIDSYTQKRRILNIPSTPPNGMRQRKALSTVKRINYPVLILHNNTARRFGSSFPAGGDLI